MSHIIDKTAHLYDMGFALLPLYPKAKNPIGNNWTEGPRMHLDTLEKICAEYKDTNNIGVRLGTPSEFEDGTFLCVLDCDMKSSDPIHVAEMEKALMSFCPSVEFSPRVLSGRGGGSCHFYFRTKTPQISFKAMRSNHKVKVYMPSIGPSAADETSLTPEEIKAGYRMRLAWEVDVFGEGKQVVLPPSIHPDTLNEYKWEAPLRDYESIPLIENFAPKKVQLAKTQKREIKFEDVDLFSAPITNKTFDLIVSGKGFEAYPSRSEALFSALNALVMAGLSDGQIYSVLTDSGNFLSEKPLQAGRGDVVKSAQWLQGQIAKIRADKDAKKHFDEVSIVDDLDEVLLTDAEAEEQEDELISWEARLQRTDKGVIKNTAYNLYLILKHAANPDKLVFSYDEFNQISIYVNEPVWGDVDDIGRELNDNDDVNIKTWLSKKWKIEVGTQSISETCTLLAKENSFHPVQRYLKSLKWDGVPRLGLMLQKYCGAVGDPELLSQVGKKFMVAACKRVFEPGCKFDHVLILEGEQGLGKSTFVNVLSSPWSSDSLGDISNKDVVDAMRGKWIIELGELASMNRAEANDLKAFITRTHDVVRKAYGRRAQTYPRQCLFVGTTNDEEYLKDTTGGRRFWPVKCVNFDNEGLANVRDQLFAEAYSLYCEKFPVYITDKRIEGLLKEEQAERFVRDELREKIEHIMGKEDFPEKFTFDDVWGRLTFGSSKLCDYAMQIRIKKILRVMNCKKIRIRDGGLREYMWLKPGLKMPDVFKEY